MKNMGICAIVSLAALAIGVLVILGICIHYEITKRATFKRFDAAADAYEEMFGADETLRILNAAQRTELGLDDISQVMEKAVKAEKEIICS